MAEPIPEGWGEYRKLVLNELERLSGQILALHAKFDILRDEEISRIKAEIAVLKFKSGLWGAAAGAIPSIAAVLYVILEKR